MNEITITVGDPWHNACLGKQEAIKLFKSIPSDIDKVIFNFGNIIYVGCLFVKEYLLLKKEIGIEISEINVWDYVQETFSLVEELGVKINDDELIQKFIDYEL